MVGNTEMNPGKMRGGFAKGYRENGTVVLINVMKMSRTLRVAGAAPWESHSERSAPSFRLPLYAPACVRAFLTYPECCYRLSDQVSANNGNFRTSESPGWPTDELCVRDLRTLLCDEKDHLRVRHKPNRAHVFGRG